MTRLVPVAPTSGTPLSDHWQLNGAPGHTPTFKLVPAAWTSAMAGGGGTRITGARAIARLCEPPAAMATTLLKPVRALPSPSALEPQATTRPLLWRARL